MQKLRLSEVTLCDFRRIKLWAEKQAPEFARQTKTYVIFLSRHRLLLETIYIYAMLWTLSWKTSVFNLLLTPNAAALIFQILSLSLEKTCFAASCIRQLGGRKLCLSRETKIYQRFKHRLKCSQRQAKKWAKPTASTGFFLLLT